MSKTEPRHLKVRVYETQVDDSGKMMWWAEAGWPSGVGASWISFAETCACDTEVEAIEALYGMLYRRARAADAGIRRLGSVMLERGLRVGMNGRVKHGR